MSKKVIYPYLENPNLNATPTDRCMGCGITRGQDKLDFINGDWYCSECGQFA